MEKCKLQIKKVNLTCLEWTLQSKRMERKLKKINKYLAKNSINIRINPCAFE